jgi:hypothetical protein
MNKVGWCLLMAAGLSAPLALASSPEPPVRAELRALRSAQGRVTVELKVTVKSGKDADEYAVDVSRPARTAPGQPEGARESVSSGAVSAAQALVLEDSLPAGRAPVVRARYELEIRRASGGYHGFLVVDQAFARAEDGSLKAIDFAEEMRLTAGKPPVVLSSDQVAAGGNRPRAKE